MKNTMVKGILLACFTTLVIACNPKKEDLATETKTVDKDQIKTEIQAMEDAYAAAYNTGNPDLIKYYADDATSFSQNKPAQVGIKAITDYLREDIAAFPKGSKMSYTVTSLHVSNDGAQVVEVGAYKMVDSTNTTKRSGNYISVFEKINGKYLCIRDMSASNMPAE
jgi:ketosteroid isomerase-like protein